MSGSHLKQIRERKGEERKYLYSMHYVLSFSFSLCMYVNIHMYVYIHM
jgi:hypothetical protein